MRDAYPLYEYCKTNRITPFIDLNPGHTGHFKYKDDFTIDEDGVPVCKMGLRMHHDGVEKAKHREKYRQGTVRNGNWSTTDGHLWRGQINGKR